MLSLWLCFIVIVILNAYILYHSKEITTPYYELMSCLGVSNMCMITYLIVSLFFIYSSPHIPLNNTLQQETAHHLLDCAIIQVPDMEYRWVEIDKCIRSAVLFNISRGHTPYSLRGKIFEQEDVTLTAFVMPKIDTESVFVTPFFSEMNLIDQALVLIHECAHIAFNAVDHAYRWEKKFMFLTKQQHRENADSFMDAVLYHCT